MYTTQHLTHENQNHLKCRPDESKNMIKRNTSQICLWVGMVLMLAVSAKASTLDPGTWSQTGNLNFGRSGHTAILLPNGKVLVAGGGMYSSTSELYDPASGTWSQTGNLNFGRSGHTATLLPNGKVLVAGGNGSSSYLVQSELYDPATGSWSQTGNLNFGRSGHTATLLPNRKVLVAGGAGNWRSSELFRPKTNAMPWLLPLLD
jgi:N-acetylneuraminic acid mutarotase